MAALGTQGDGSKIRETVIHIVPVHRGLQSNREVPRPFMPTATISRSSLPSGKTISSLHISHLAFNERSRPMPRIESPASKDLDFLPCRVFSTAPATQPRVNNATSVINGVHSSMCSRVHQSCPEEEANGAYSSNYTFSCT
jgi:hypothetical protein